MNFPFLSQNRKDWFIIEILDKEERIKRLDNMIWSFSRLNGFSTCKWMWYLSYMLNEEEKQKYEIVDVGKFFALYGTFAHNIFEKYNKGELEIFQLYDYCKDNFETEIPVSAPPNKYVDIYTSYQEKLLNYFMKYNGNDNEVVFSENEITYDIRLSKDKVISFHGFIDLLLKDKNGNFILQDYKSKSDFKNKEEYKSYLRQLLLYSKGVYSLYHKYPKKLVFDMFKIGKVYESEFKKEDLQEALKWVKSTIDNIYNEEEFARKCENPENDFFCKYVCGYGTETCLRMKNT